MVLTLRLVLGQVYTCNPHSWKLSVCECECIQFNKLYVSGTPEVAGLTPVQSIEIIRGCRGLNVVGADVVEVLFTLMHFEYKHYTCIYTSFVASTIA